MDLDISSNQSQMSVNYSSLSGSEINMIAKEYHNVKINKNIPQSTRDKHALIFKETMPFIFGDKTYKCIVEEYKKLDAQQSVNLPQNDNDIQIHITI